MVILTIPLIDLSLDVNLHKVHNLPMLHPQLQIQVVYELKSAYFATHMHGMYATIPKETDIKPCLMSQGHLCMFEEPLYQVDKLDWCLYALFINDLTKIESNCKFTTTIRHTNLAHSLDGYLWAISSLATEKLQIRCLHQTSVVTIEPPLRIIDIGNGQGSHSSCKTWKNGDSFSSLEKSWNFVIFAKYPGKMRQTLEI